MHLNEVECVVGELIGHFVPLHGWSAGTASRPGNEEQGEEGDEEGAWCERRKGDQKEEKYKRQTVTLTAGGKDQFFMVWTPIDEKKVLFPKINESVALNY